MPKYLRAHPTALQQAHRRAGRRSYGLEKEVGRDTVRESHSTGIRLYRQPLWWGIFYPQYILENYC